MALTNEEIAADLTWRYVEHLRTRDAGAGEPLTSAELAELARTLETAGLVSGSVATESLQPAPESLRRRVLAHAGQPSVAAAPARSRRFRPGRAAWISGLAAALGAAAGAAFAVASVDSWHPAPPPRHIVANRPVNVELISEESAHALIPQMVENRLPPGEERNVMWHMLVCRGCFEQYVQLRHHHRTAEEPRTPILSPSILARR